MSLDSFLLQRGATVGEGYSQQVPGQVRDLITLSAAPNIRVMEIGFNAGHSAEVFLKNNPTLTLTSFDIGIHTYVAVSKEYIDATFRDRHTLVIGDSTKSVPEFVAANPSVKFDVIFIDGGHDYPIAKADLKNCMALAHKDTILIIDDTIYTPRLVADWTMGPTSAWLEMIANGSITETAKAEYAYGRGMSWGKYNISD